MEKIYLSISEIVDEELEDDSEEFESDLSFVCPVCGNQIVINDEDSYCEHVMYVHEPENTYLQYSNHEWNEMCRELLVRKVKSAESFLEYLYSNCVDEECDTDELKSAAEDEVDNYIEDGLLTTDEIVDVIQASRRTRLLDAMKIYVAEDDCSGLSTECIICDEKVLSSYK